MKVDSVSFSTTRSTWQRLFGPYFKVRAPDRDRATDISWANSLCTVCDEIMLKINHELVGLALRYQRASNLAANTFGNEACIPGEREAEDEAALTAAENEMARALARINQLELQREHLVKIRLLAEAWPLHDYFKETIYYMF